MTLKRKMFLSNYVINQYPIEKLKQIIFITLDIVETFLLELEEEFNYDSTSIASYGEKYGSYNYNGSKIESLYIRNVDNKEAMTNFLNKYYKAYSVLNADEKKIFDATFIDRLSDVEIIDKYKTYSRQVVMIRKSAVVRFSIKAGLDKFINIV